MAISTAMFAPWPVERSSLSCGFGFLGDELGVDSAILVISSDSGTDTERVVTELWGGSAAGVRGALLNVEADDNSISELTATGSLATGLATARCLGSFVAVDRLVRSGGSLVFNDTYLRCWAIESFASG